MATVEALAPVCLSCLAIVACCYSGIGDYEEVFSFCDRAWYIRAVLVGLEYDVCFSYVACAGGVYQLDVAVGEAACHEEEFAVIDERCDVLLCGAVDDPVLLACIGVVACDAEAS